MTRTPLAAACVLGLSLFPSRAENALQSGDFAGSTPGSPPPAPWVASKDRPDVTIRIENPPGETAGTWLRMEDRSSEDAAVVSQKFSAMAAGRLSFKLHVKESGAAIWFLFGRGESAGRGDAVFGFKITSRGDLLVAQDRQKITDTSGARPKFPPGQTCELICTFRPEGDGTSVEITQPDGAVLFRGSSPAAGPVGALAIRTHGEEAGSEFFVTDLALHPVE